VELLLTYDVETTTREGRRRLHKVAQICEGYGQRVQYSVFEIVIDEPEYVKLVAGITQLLSAADSVRIYRLEHGSLRRVIHLGVRKHLPHDEAWVL
jgi:CRISPR-associated protein Cas2